jgi:hypothetical protein
MIDRRAGRSSAFADIMADRFHGAMRLRIDGRMQRPLTVLLAADVPGYGPLTKRDPARTLQRVKANRGPCLDPRVARRVTALCLMMIAIAGCAIPAAKPAYVGVFTGEFVDGLPLYRLPTIDVTGSRTRSSDVDGS